MGLFGQILVLLFLGMGTKLNIDPSENKKERFGLEICVSVAQLE